MNALLELFLSSFNCDFRTDIPEDELDEIISSIHVQFNVSSAAAASSTTVDDTTTVCTTAVEDRRLRNLRKKLDQIEALKERQQRGEILEANQVCTIMPRVIHVWSIVWYVVRSTVACIISTLGQTCFIVALHINFAAFV